MVCLEDWRVKFRLISVRVFVKWGSISVPLSFYHGGGCNLQEFVDSRLGTFLMYKRALF